MSYLPSLGIYKKLTTTRLLIAAALPLTGLQTSPVLAAVLRAGDSLEVPVPPSSVGDALDVSQLLSPQDHTGYSPDQTSAPLEPDSTRFGAREDGPSIPASGEAALGEASAAPMPAGDLLRDIGRNIAPLAARESAEQATSDFDRRYSNGKMHPPSGQTQAGDGSNASPSVKSDAKSKFPALLKGVKTSASSTKMIGRAAGMVPPAIMTLRHSMIEFAKKHPDATSDEIMAAGDASGFRNSLRWMAKNLAKANAELRMIAGRDRKNEPGWNVLVERSKVTLSALKKAAAAPRIDYKTYADLGVDYAMAVTFPEWETAAVNPGSISGKGNISDARSVAHLLDCETMFAQLKIRGGILDFPVVYEERGLVPVQEMNDAAPAYDIAGLLGPHETLENGFYDAWGFLIHDLSHHGDRAAQLPADAEASERAAAADLLEYLYFDAWHESSVDFVPATFAKKAAEINGAIVMARAVVYGMRLPDFLEPGFAEKVASVYRRATAAAATGNAERLPSRGVRE